MKVFTLIMLAIAFNSSSAFADRNHCNVPIQYREVISNSVVYTTESCKETIPLALVQGAHAFSFGAYVAEYWQGQYQRGAEEIAEVRYSTYNCWGQLIFSKTVTEKSRFQVSFNIENANLRDDASWADIKAPMTDDEAAAAFAKARRRCEDSKL